MCVCVCVCVYECVRVRVCVCMCVCCGVCTEGWPAHAYKLRIKERRRDGEGRQGAPLCHCVMKSRRVG